MTDDGRGIIALGDGAEFDAIRGLLARWCDVASGIGDDAALLEVPRGDQLVASVDSFVVGRHFRPEWITPREAGYRATVAALSDLAAMAALPIGVLFTVHLPDDWSARLGEIGDGVGEATRAAGTRIVGGNISAASELAIVTTVLGHVRRPLRRSGAADGDRLFVTGTLGGPGAAVAAWKSGAKPSEASRARFAQPTARLREARWLVDRGATAGIDISDGVVADARHLAAASGVRIELALDRLPVVAGVAPADAAASGEEYELLVTMPAADASAFSTEFGIPLTEIGVVRRGAPEVVVFDGGARVASVPGHDHFSE